MRSLGAMICTVPESTCAWLTTALHHQSGRHEHDCKQRL